MSMAFAMPATLQYRKNPVSIGKNEKNNCENCVIVIAVKMAVMIASFQGQAEKIVSTRHML